MATMPGGGSAATDTSPADGQTGSAAPMAEGAKADSSKAGAKAKTAKDGKAAPKSVKAKAAKTTKSKTAAAKGKGEPTTRRRAASAASGDGATQGNAPVPDPDSVLSGLVR